jgi:hypothetical protein
VYTKADDRSAACKTEISADFGIDVEPQADAEASTRSKADDPSATRAEINAEPVPDMKPQRDGAASAAPEDRSSKVTDAGVELPNNVGPDVGVEPATGAEPTVGCGWPDRRQLIQVDTVAGPVAVPAKTAGAIRSEKLKRRKASDNQPDGCLDDGPADGRTANTAATRAYRGGVRGHKFRNRGRARRKTRNTQ